MFAGGPDAWLLGQIAAIPIAQFYIEKTKENQPRLITDEEYRRYLDGHRTPQGQATAMAWALANRKRFFHWFLEFPEIIEQGGFDCILGNPPYLGGQDLSGTYGYPFCHYVKWEYAPAGLSDLVTFFVRRIYTLLCPGGFTSFITTNSIKDGDIRKDGLEQVLAQGGTINFAVRGIKWPGRANLVVSLVGIHRGKWGKECYLDGKVVQLISPFFEDSLDAGEPDAVKENADNIFQGSIFSGDGFLMTHDEASLLLQENSSNQEVIYQVINGQEINNDPEQKPGRSIINFFDWNIEKAATYNGPFERLERLVKQERLNNSRIAHIPWWQYERPRLDVYRDIFSHLRCFVAAATTKYLNFSAAPTNYVFLNTLFIFTTDRWDLYSVVQSTIHEVWARKYSGALKQDLRYSPSKCFDTFPFPAGIWQAANPALAAIGERYHEYRRALMLRLWLGLTDIYNLFHNRDLTPAIVAKVSGKPGEAEAGYQGILELRKLHRELDEAVLAAYGWTDSSTGAGPAINLGHDFYEVETLPENDRVRYTISPDARKELLKRLLALNHQRAAEEKAKAPVKAVKVDKVKAAKDKKAAPEVPGLFDLTPLALLSFPSTPKEKIITAAALAIIENAGEISSMDHLDVLLLATHPEWCKAFLDASGRKLLSSAVAGQPVGFSSEGHEPIRWKDCRDYLEKRQALQIDRASHTQTIKRGENIVAVEASLPTGTESIVAIALEALKEVKRLRNRTDSASEDQELVLQIFEQRHQEYRLVA